MTSTYVGTDHIPVKRKAIGQAMILIATILLVALFITQTLHKAGNIAAGFDNWRPCLLYTSPSPRDATLSRMPSSA